MYRSRLLLGTVAFLSCVSFPLAGAAPTLDLTTAGSSGWIGPAFFNWCDASSTGTGLIESFVRIGSNLPVKKGYNTNFRPLEFQENSSPQFTRALPLSFVPIVDIGGTLYREFLLDINQNSGEPDQYLSLDTIEIYMGGAGDLTGYPSGLGTKIYDLDASADNWIKLNYQLNHGSGSGDMFAYIPSALFTGGNYVYLYSEFGGSESSAFPNNDGFEEWAVRTTEPLPIIPAPGAVLLAALGTGLVGCLRRRGMV